MTLEIQKNIYPISRTSWQELESEDLADLRDKLLRLQSDPAFQILLCRVESLRQDQLNQLSREADLTTLRHLQGRTQAYSTVLGLVSTIVKELEDVRSNRV